MRADRGWLRTTVWVVVGLAILLAVVAALTGALLLVALIGGLAALNLLYLPRAAARLRIAPVWLAVLLIPVAILVGALAGGLPGAAWGAAVWIASIGLPRLIGRNVVRRARRRSGWRGYVEATFTRPTGRPDGRPLPPADGRARDEFGL